MRFLGFSSEVSEPETGLNYYNYRYLASNIGRWTRRDSLNEISGNNLYCLTKNAPISSYDMFGLLCEDKCSPLGLKKIVGAKYQILSTTMGENPSKFNDISDLIDNLTVLQAIISAGLSLGSGATPKAILVLVASQLPDYQTSVLKGYISMINWGQGNRNGARVFTVILYQECEIQSCCFGLKRKLDFSKIKQSDPKNCIGKNTMDIIGDIPHFGSSRSALENVGRCIHDHKMSFKWFEDSLWSLY